MKRLFTIFLCVLLSSGVAVADDKEEVQQMLTEKIDAIVALLQDKALDKKLRNERIIDVITPTFDYQTMAKLSLGKKHWPSLTQAEQETFSVLFIKRLQASYLEKLDIYTDEKVLYGEAEQKGNKVYMPTTLVSSDSRIEMLYKLYRTQDGWKIYDVEIGGVSVIQTYRSQFDGILQDGSPADLFEKLKTDGAIAIPALTEKVNGPGP